MQDHSRDTISKWLADRKSGHHVGRRSSCKTRQHTVGPIYGTNDGRDSELLADCYLNSIHLAVDNDIETIAFPSISTGAFGYPKHEAAKVSSTAIVEAVKADTRITEVRL